MNMFYTLVVYSKSIEYVFTEEEDGETETFLQSQETASNITSKDVVQLSRCSASLHIFLTSLQAILTGQVVNIPLEIPLSTVRLAHHFYTTSCKQKAVFVEV